MAIVPVLIVLIVMARWSMRTGTAIYGLIRMVAQLLLVGYVLGYIFEATVSWPIMVVLTVMILVASWISLRVIPQHRPQHWKYAVTAIAVGGGLTLCVITQGVLGLDPWYSPRVLIPLAGMTFSGAMNSVSLAAERYQGEIERHEPHLVARERAIQAALIPLTNSLFAVGVVSIPGMMTGQVLSGTSPIIAARYQIMVMCMIFGAGGLAATIYLWLIGSSGGAEQLSGGAGGQGI